MAEFFNKKRIIVGLFLSALFALRYYTALPVLDQKFIGSYVGSVLTVRGIIQKPPVHRQFFQELEIAVESMMFFEKQYPLTGIIFARTIPEDSLQYGDFVEVKGLLETSFRNDPRSGGIIKKATVHARREPQHPSFQSILFQLRDRLVARLETVFPYPHDQFVAGLLLGVRSEIPREVTEDFRKSGVTHIIALSGFNIVIIIAFIQIIFSFLPRKFSDVAAIIFIALFTLLVGASASVIRAAIMGSLGVFARLVGRKTAGLRTLFITGYGMAMLDPFIVLWDIGFQLSFTATAGILLFARRWQEFFKKWPALFGAKDTLIVTIAAQVFTVPLIIFYFRSISIISPIANIFVLPFIPFIMLGGFLSLFFGSLVAVPTSILCTIILSMIHFFASLPFASFEIV